jgi:hypothetical protein
MRVVSRLLAAVSAVVLGCTYLSPSTAIAAVPSRTGWWTQAQQSTYLGNRQLPLAATPNAGDFHIGNADCAAQSPPCVTVPNNPVGPSPVNFGPTAISAVDYPLPGGGLPMGTDPGTVIAQFTLAVDGAPVGAGFKLLACRILGDWLPVNGGDWTQRPPYQPGGCALGVASVDGLSVSFTIVAALASRTDLGLALVPAFGDPTTFMILLKSDNANALTWKPVGPAPTSNNSHGAIPPASTGPLVNTSTGLGLGIRSPANPPPASTPAAAAPGAAAPAVSVGPGTVVAPQAAGVTTERRALLLLAVILATVFAAWSAPLRRLLSSDRDVARGVGRFVRNRTAHARPL